MVFFLAFTCTCARVRVFASYSTMAVVNTTATEPPHSSMPIGMRSRRNKKTFRGSSSSFRFVSFSFLDCLFSAFVLFSVPISSLFFLVDVNLRQTSGVHFSSHPRDVTTRTFSDRRGVVAEFVDFHLKKKYPPSFIPKKMKKEK